MSLPFKSGKKLTILAFGKNAADSGADIVGDESSLVEIEKGKVYNQNYSFFTWAFNGDTFELSIYNTTINI